MSSEKTPLSTDKMAEALKHASPELLTFLDPEMCEDGVRKIKLAKASYTDYRTLIELLSSKYIKYVKTPEGPSSLPEGFSSLPENIYTRLLETLPAHVTAKLARCSSPSPVTVEAGDVAELHDFSTTHKHMPPGYVFLATSEETKNFGYIAQGALIKPNKSFIRSAPVVVLSQDVVKKAGESEHGFKHLVEVASHELAHGILTTTKHPEHLGLLERHSVNACTINHMRGAGITCATQEVGGESLPEFICDTTIIPETMIPDPKIYMSQCAVKHPAEAKEGDCQRAQLMTDIACQEGAEKKIEKAYEQKDRMFSAYSLASTAAATCFRISMRHYVIPACSDYLTAHGHLNGRNRRYFDEAAMQAVEVASHMITASDILDGIIKHAALTAMRLAVKKIGLGDTAAAGIIEAFSASFSENSILERVASAAAHGGSAIAGGTLAQEVIKTLPKLKGEDAPAGIQAAAIQQAQAGLHRRR